MVKDAHRFGGCGTRPDGLSLSSVSGASQGLRRGDANSWEREDQHIKCLLHPHAQPLAGTARRLGSAKTIPKAPTVFPSLEVSVQWGCLHSTWPPPENRWQLLGLFWPSQGNHTHHVIYMLWVTSEPHVQPEARRGIRSYLPIKEHKVVLYKKMWDEKCCRGQL